MAAAARRVCNHSGFRYTIEKVIGEGAFGTVYLIFSLETGERVALKRVCEDTRYKSRELEILKSVHHPNCLWHRFRLSKHSRKCPLSRVKRAGLSSKNSSFFHISVYKFRCSFACIHSAYHQRIAPRSYCLVLL